MLAPKDYTRFWGEQGDKFKYLANLVKSIIQVDLEMRKNKHNVEVVRDLEIYCCLHVTLLHLFVSSETLPKVILLTDHW